MGIRLAPIEPDQFLDFARAGAIGFGSQIVDEDDIKDMEPERELMEFDRTLAAFDGDRIVATGAIFSFSLTVPGGEAVPAAGVSWISVNPTHRRQGILTRIMRRQLDDARERGEPVAILWASESLIYGRFGYGAASSQFHFEIDPRHAALRHEPESDGSVRFVDRDMTRETLPGIYDCYRVLQPGAITRSSAYWNVKLADIPRHRHGSSPYFAVVYEGSGGPEGYALYRVKEKWEGGFPQNSVSIREMVASTPAAYTALWRFCLSIDLVTTVASYGPPDEPLRWMLADPRRLTAKSFSDNLWVRIIDIPAALCGRRYAATDRLVLGLHDAFLPDNSGTYMLEAGQDGATCRPTDEAPDLELEIADLGAAYLGGVRFSTLARAGRVRECRPRALRCADTLFASDRDPICVTEF